MKYKNYDCENKFNRKKKKVKQSKKVGRQCPLLCYSGVSVTNLSRKFVYTIKKNKQRGKKQLKQITHDENKNKKQTEAK